MINIIIIVIVIFIVAIVFLFVAVAFHLKYFDSGYPLDAEYQLSERTGEEAWKKVTIINLILPTFFLKTLNCDIFGIILFH